MKDSLEQKTMKLKNGDVVTLDNGDIVKVSLKLVKKKVIELEIDSQYRLVRTGSFCHITGESQSILNTIWTYVGKITTNNGLRHIFMVFILPIVCFQTKI